MVMGQPANTEKSTLGIVAGGGSMPAIVAEAALASDRPVHIVGIEGFAGDNIGAFPHDIVGIGQIGRLLDILGKNGCRQIVIVGVVRRPNLLEVKIDMGAIANMASILSWTVGGDNSMLSAIVALFEEKGFEVTGAHEIAPGLLAGEGTLGKRKPSKEDREDIRTGLEVVAALGAHDVGQAAVVARKYVLAVEAAEGTDLMLERCVGMRPWGAGSLRSRRGVLVKSAKPGQDRRIDLPAIGPETVRRAAEAGLAGIAIVSGDVMIAEREETVRLADGSGLFLYGAPAGEAS